MSMFLGLMAMCSLIFMFLNHPLSFGFILLIQTILISLMTGSMSLNYWYSYIIFLIMIGGMLVLFIYMTSIASNEKFNLSSLIFIGIILSMIFILFTIILTDPFFFNYLNSNYELMMMNKNPNYTLAMIKYINSPNNSIFFLMIIYLLVTLIAVVKITDINYGPLRQKS